MIPQSFGLPGAANYGWLEHAPEKWKPVFRKSMLKQKMTPGSDSAQLN
jgi:hypothetical protein